MDRQELMRDMKRTYDKSMISTSQIRDFMGISWERADAMMAGADFIPSGRAKMYFIGDVADRIMKARG